MALPVSGQVGPTIAGDSVSTQPLRQGRLGELNVSELQGRFYEQNYRGNLFSGGMALTSINNATFSTATLGATCTPIAGIWNPVGSGVNAVILQAALQVAITALQNTGPGPFMWAASVGNGALTLGSAPLSRSTLQKAGSKCKDMTGIALTGLTNNLVVMNASGLASGNVFSIATLCTAAGLATLAAPSSENIDGAWIVPPGGVLALLASTNAPVAHSAASGLLWNEVQVA